MLGVFIDGPLAREVRGVNPAWNPYRVAMPARETICDCDGFNDVIHSAGPEEVIYYRIAAVPTVGIFSVHDDEREIERSLVTWVHTDIVNADTLRVMCGDRRAFE